MIVNRLVHTLFIGMGLLAVACTAGDADKPSNGSGAGSLGNEQKEDSNPAADDGGDGSELDSIAVKPDGSFGDVTESDTEWCADPHFPLDNNNPYERECWDPPWSYCANGCYGAGSRACSPDGAVCCQFACSCVPCGWKHCLCSGGPTAECEESGCGPVTEGAPECDFDPMAYDTNPKPMICWDGLLPPSL